jgi:multiple sugar transport system permease protein
MSRSKPRRHLFHHKDASTLTLRMWEFTGTAVLNLLIWVAVVLYLSPLSYMFITSLKSPEQFHDTRAPAYPAKIQTFEYNGKLLQVYNVPTSDGVKNWAMIDRFRTYSDFIDPANPGAGPIRWEGFWGSLTYHYIPSVTLNNFVNLWKTVNYPNLLRNTFIVIGLGEIGILCSSIMVAYGFARFPVPGGKYLFLLLIATIMIPDSITLVPTFVLYGRVLNWTGTFYPLIVPTFFGSAIYIFLLRQNFKSIPRDLDEAAMLDGAGPLRTLVSIVLPQAIPTVVTVALLYFFNAWNEMKVASLYLGIRPDLQTIAFSAQVSPSYGFTPETLQASALLLMVIPVIVIFLTQRYFMQDMVIADVEK